LRGRRPGVAAWRDLDIVLAGFVENVAAGRNGFVAALARHGAKLTRVDTLAAGSIACDADERRIAL